MPTVWPDATPNAVNGKLASIDTDCPLTQLVRPQVYWAVPTTVVAPPICWTSAVMPPGCTRTQPR
jgi:hypothetical protein